MLIDNKAVFWQDSNSIIISNHSDFKKQEIIQTNEIMFNGPHIKFVDKKPIFINEPRTYTYEPNTIFSNINIKPSINKYIKNIKKFNKIAEIGGRYGSSSIWILDNMNEDAYLDIYEVDKDYADIIKDRLKDYNNYDLIYGDARETIKQDVIYDLIFFDCSHIFDIDKVIFDKLKNNIDENTIIIFDDYFMPDVRKLVRYALKDYKSTNIIYRQKFLTEGV